MALLSKQKGLSDLLTKGIIGDIVTAWGIGAAINFIDDKTGHHLKGIGVNLGRTVNGQPLSLNLTDGVFALATTGLNLSGKGMMKTLVGVGSKKAGEAFGIILDDPLPTQLPRPEKMSLPEINIGAPAPMPMIVHTGSFGGLNA